jgi:hypothetical protein
MVYANVLQSQVVLFTTEYLLRTSNSFSRSYELTAHPGTNSLMDHKYVEGADHDCGMEVDVAYMSYFG